MALRRTAFHQTAVAQHNAVLADDQTDYVKGDHVMTCDGFPGRVTAVLYGPYQGAESYQVELDAGMGGGDYAPGQLSPLRRQTASRVEAEIIQASIPVEAVTDHTANTDYPELENILTERIPNENIKIYAAVNTDTMDRPDSSKEDSTENLDQDNPIEEPDPAKKDPADGEENPEDQSEEADNGEGNAKLGDVTPPSACSFCGGSSFGEPKTTGRGVRVTCDQCHGTMTSWGGQWQPDPPNTPENHASQQWDYRSGGPGGIGQAPGAQPYEGQPNESPIGDPEGKDEEEDGDGKTLKIKISTLTQGLTNAEMAESLQSEAGIVQYLFNRLYDKARAKYEHNQIEWWMPPQSLTHQTIEGPANYDPQLVQPHVPRVGSVSEYDDPDWKWHFTSTWMDVQAKARKIRQDNHVKIVTASKLYVVAEVQGDTATYETQLNYVPGTRKVADWACGCKWASYAWGRSKHYQRFEGRLCSHALATQYEASARGIFGKDVQPDSIRPDWQKAHSPVVVQYDKGTGKDLTRRAVPPGNMKRTFSSLIVDSDGIYPEPQLLDLAHPPIYASVRTMVDNESPLGDVIEMMASSGVEKADARSMLFEALLSEADPEEDHLLREGTENASESLSASARTARVIRRTHVFIQGQDKPLCGAHETGEPKQADGAFESDHDKRDYCQTCHDLMPEGETLEAHPFYHEAVLVTADYSTADPLVGLDGGHNIRPSVQHSTSENPGSTGFATSQDPGDWGKSLISNDFGVTFDASLHKISDDMMTPVETPDPFGPIAGGLPHHHEPGAPHEGGEAAEGAEDLEALATLHDGPEAALPFTDGTSEEADVDAGAGNTSGGPHGSSTFDTTNSIIAAFQRTAGGQALAKEAMKDFSFAEQQDLINEGQDVRARNFDDLKIAGTHYELIGESDPDESILWV